MPKRSLKKPVLDFLYPRIRGTTTHEIRAHISTLYPTDNLAELFDVLDHVLNNLSNNGQIYSRKDYIHKNFIWYTKNAPD